MAAKKEQTPEKKEVKENNQEEKSTKKESKESFDDHLVFNKWSVKDIKIEDPGLKDYIALGPKIVPKTNRKYITARFGKSKMFIVERLMNKLFTSGHKGKKHARSSGHQTGKTETVYRIVYEAFNIIEQKVKENPVKVFVKAVEHAAPREEVVSIEYGGARYPQAVECAPQRRIDIVLRMMTQGAYSRSFNSKKLVASALADEIMNAYNYNNTSMAIAKKFELERQADASR